MLHARVSAIRADGTLVGDRLREIDARVLEAIDARKNLRPDHAPERLVARKGSAVVVVLGIDGGNDAVLVESDARIAEGAFVAVGARNHVFGASLDPLNGTAAGFLGGQGADRHLRIAGDLDAEAAADVEGLDANAIDVDVQVRREKLNGERGKRIVAPVVDALVFGIPLSDDDVVLERRGREAVEMQAVDVNDVGGVFKRLLDVAVFEDAVPDFVGAAFFVENAFVGERVFGVDDRVERFVFDLDEFSGIVGEASGFGYYGGDRFALVTDLSDGQRVVFDLAGGVGPISIKGFVCLRDLCPGEGADDAGQGFRADVSMLTMRA